MVTYEVTAIVRPDLADAYETYMRRHVIDVLATKKFVSASFARAAENRYRAWYHAPSQESLDRYLAEDTTRRRAEFATHFPSGVELTREVWQTIEVWPP